MAQITINEISQNYTYNIGSSSFATVALPITACWGPGYLDPNTLGYDESAVLDATKWEHFPATREGLEAFVSTYRGPSSTYRLTKDYSYHMAMSLLTSGYDVLVCRVCSGTAAENTVYFSKDADATTITSSTQSVTIKAKYAGKFGDNILVKFKHIPTDATTSEGLTKYYHNAVIYVVDPDTKIQTAVENLIFVFDEANSTDSILHINEIESNFVTFELNGSFDDTEANMYEYVNGADKYTRVDQITLSGGQDVITEPGKDKSFLDAAKEYAEKRYGADSAYPKLIAQLTVDTAKAAAIATREWNFTAAYKVYDLLEDKLSYSPNRVISPGWDDQDISFLSEDAKNTYTFQVSPLHAKLMDVACLSRCATAYIDIPKDLAPNSVYDESSETPGYAQKLAQRTPGTIPEYSTIYQTHSALFAPWGQYRYVGTNKQCTASPSFMALLIQRAMILNQPTQYEWILPTNRKHNLPLGKLDYIVTNRLLTKWQSTEGVGVNVITTIPDLGTSLWGNSTLYEVPPATYQALANLSTRLLVNAIEDVAYRAGIAITFNYNNSQAYDRFYAAVTPILDTMKNAGAIEDYYVRMAADINGLDQVNANSVIGKIYLIVNGVINDIIVDLVALPPSADLSQFKG